MAKKNSEKKDRSTHIVVAIVILIIVVAVIVAFKTFSTSTPEVGVVEVPKVNFSIDAPDRSESHSFEVKFNLEGNVEELKKLDLVKVQQLIRETLSNSEYDKLVAENGMEYARELVYNNIAKQLNKVGEEDFNFTGVYIDEFYGSIYNSPENKDEGNKGNENNPTGKNVTDLFKR